MNPPVNPIAIREASRQWYGELMLGKYRNPDPRCRYPFAPKPLCYCWGYALCVDEKSPPPSCVSCEYWEEEL